MFFAIFRCIHKKSPAQSGGFFWWRHRDCSANASTPLAHSLTLHRHAVACLSPSGRTPFSGSNLVAFTKNPPHKAGDIFGGDTGIRTLDPMIKSHLLYQLSYVSKTEQPFSVRGIFWHIKKRKSSKKCDFL